MSVHLVKMGEVTKDTIKATWSMMHTKKSVQVSLESTRLGTTYSSVHFFDLLSLLGLTDHMQSDVEAGCVILDLLSLWHSQLLYSVDTHLCRNLTNTGHIGTKRRVVFISRNTVRCLNLLHPGGHLPACVF